VTKDTSVSGWSRGGSRTRGGDPGRGLVTQRAVRPLGLVFISPIQVAVSDRASLMPSKFSIAGNSFRDRPWKFSA
jgi:hypothetical protein